MPFLRDAWYVAAHAHELDAPVVSRRICNEPIVMFRTAAGEAAALQDRCPHRFVPLSMGKRVGDAIECGYHGLRFGAAGGCVEAPNDRDNANLRACVKSYPVVERHGLVWLWMGRAEAANPADIPEFGFITDKARFASSQGYSHMRANYQLIVDNLLDLSHVHYLHPEIDAGSDFANFRNEVRVEGDTIWSMLWRPHCVFDEARRKFHGFAANDVEGQGHARWNAPGVIQVFTGWWDHGKTLEEGVQSPSAHLLTPETEFTTHYFWAIGRTYAKDDAELSRKNAAMVKQVFETQDGPMIEAQQAAMGASTDFLEQKPIILKADAAGVMARRLLKRKIAEERAAAAAAIAAE